VTERFADRAAGGRALAARLVETLSRAGPGMAVPGGRLVVLALPRGGVPVAAEVARALDAPLDVLVVRKLGVPAQPELGMGAIGEDGVRVLNDDVVRSLRIPDDAVARVEARERTELDRRARRYRGGAPMVGIDGAMVVIVDDGIATGGTARAAVAVARAHGAARVVLAAPVAPDDTVEELRAVADDVVVCATPPRFEAIGKWYDDFRQTTDEEVTRAVLSG
jgi:putative phosphoribosyl transferase